MKVDVASLGCDFYVFSGHKLYGPTGIGALWARLRSWPKCRHGRAAAR
jgi:selenocysteine lyase/cysteine desulfurase